MFLKRDLIWKSYNCLSSRFLSLSKRGIYTDKELLDKENESEVRSEQTDSETNSEQLEDNVNKKEEAARKMKELLLSMKKADFNTQTNIELPQPRIFGRKRELEFKKELEEKEKQKLGNRLSEAAQEVAKTLGGDEKKTEKELLELLTKSKEQPPDNAIPENVDTEEMNEDTQEQQDKQINLSELIAGMKIDMTTSESSIPLEQTRAYQIKKMLMKKSGKEDELKQFFISRKSRRYSSTQHEKVDIFGESPLGIFDVDRLREKSAGDSSVNLSTWSALSARELRLCVTQPPSNIYEQMILWTKQGKLWRFPIDNEQDMKEEQQIDFTEHVFLEKHLEPWCPTEGPIRHFMELVCVGLSRNPFQTVDEKVEHIHWYEAYFRAKRDILIRAELEPVKDREDLHEAQQQR